MFESIRRLEGARGALVATAVIAAALLTSCGGASNANGPDSPPVLATAQSCSANNPFRGDATDPTTTGTLTIEKAWLRNYIDNQYLWFSEVPDVNPSIANYSNESDVFTSLDNYFNALTELPQDRFSFIYPTAAWDALINSGSSVGYGIEWHIASSTPPRGIRVAYVHPNSPAATAGVLRGDTLVLADGVSADVPSSDPAYPTLINSLYPGAAGSHTFRFSRAGAVRPDVAINAGNVTLTPTEHQVLNVSGQNVGYLLFNDHVLTAEQPLINAFTTFQNAGVTDLVLDLRYNGGGYLYIASQVAYMIAGAPPNNEVFERTVFSSKRTGENSDTEFIDVACVPNPSTFQCTSNAALPTLNLPRVFVLVSGSTCSASEAIINGLRGVDIEVRLIGGTTCGKPYGFFGQDNCGITYFPIEFQGINAKNFGDYAGGFVPSGSSNVGSNVTGCAANDDLDHALGDPAEGQLAQALFNRANGSTSCLAVAIGGSRETPLSAKTARRASVVKPLALTNRNARKPLR
jgi:carboxyl-terminal processing protease